VFEKADRVGEGHFASAGVTEPGERPGFHCMEVGGERGRGGVLGSAPGRACKVGGVLKPAEECGLVAHGVEDAAAQ
jgi:hypothetical protein